MIIRIRGYIFILICLITFSYNSYVYAEIQQYQKSKSANELISGMPGVPAEKLTKLIGIYDDKKKLATSHLILLEDGGKLFLFNSRKYYLLKEMCCSKFRIPEKNPFSADTISFSRNKSGYSDYCEICERRFERVVCDQRITPLKPIEELRKEALNANPTLENDKKYESDLVEIVKFDNTIRLNMKYATSDNFMGTPFYSEAKAYLQRPVAKAVVRVSADLKKYGYGLIIYDAYRPWYVTKMFWDATPDNQKQFVADPKKGSLHNRGSAVDITLYNLKTGKPLDMGGFYDEFGERAYPDFPGGISVQRWHRAVLRFFMEKEGFKVYPYEWWHFNYGDCEKYPIMNSTFEQLSELQK